MTELRDDIRPAEQTVAHTPAPAGGEARNGRALVPPALAAVALGVLGAAVAAAASRPEFELPRGERLLFRARPRRDPLRSLATLGACELGRRATSFFVTDRRVIVDRGIFRRTTRSIPLAGIVDVEVVSGPWQGVVYVAEHGLGAPQKIGPLRTSAARGFAAAIARAIDS